MGINVFMQNEINLDFKAIIEIEHFKDRDQKGGHLKAGVPTTDHLNNKLFISQYMIFVTRHLF